MANQSESKILYYWEEGGREFAISPRKSKKDGRVYVFRLYQEVNSKRTLIHPPDLLVINQNFKKKIIDEESAVRQLKVLIENLYKERDKRRPKNVIWDANRDLLERYWAEEYGPSRQVVDKSTMHNDFLRAIAAVGQKSLIASERLDLQNTVNSYFADKPDTQRRAVSRLNTLLKYAGRGFGLKKMRESFKPIRHLTLKDFEKMIGHIPDPNFRLLCRVALATGCRVSEIHGLLESDFKMPAGFVLVAKQLKRKAVEQTPTKNRKVRKAYVLQEGRPWLDAWFALDDATRNSLRDTRQADHVRAACKKAFEGTKLKQCTFHDLRHSYAIHLLGTGVPLDFVAQSLGNSRAVCEKYYTGYVLSDASISLIDQIYTKGS
jgi:integrase